MCDRIAARFTPLRPYDDAPTLLERATFWLLFIAAMATFVAMIRGCD